jgi:hypothetical protein
MNVRSLGTWFAGAMCAGFFAACAGGTVPPASGPTAALDNVDAAAKKITLKPLKVSVAVGASVPVAVAEKRYKGRFTIASKGKTSCAGIASWTPRKGNGPRLTINVKGLKAGTCAITIGDTAKQTAKLPVTVTAPPPLDYIYTANYNSNDISQLVLNADGTLVALAPNYKLPASCLNPNTITLLPKQNMAFVTCYSSGQVLALNLDSNHQLVASPIAPVAVARPAALLVPSSGVAARLYVSTQSTPVTLAAFGYSATSLTQLATYSTAQGPAQMAFNTDANGVSTLYVAANDIEQCGGGSSSGGAIEPWLQDSNGLLTEQTVIPTCGVVTNVVAANGNLYWAGAVLGGYSLTTSAPLVMPSPPWSVSQGPYYPGAMNVISVQPAPAVAAARRSPKDDENTNFSIDAGDGNIYILTPSGAIAQTIPVSPTGGTTPAATCVDVSPAVEIGGTEIAEICWSINADGIAVLGTTPDNTTIIDLGTIVDIGGEPLDLALAAGSEFGTIH